jgi:hypothetical protein
MKASWKQRQKQQHPSTVEDRPVADAATTHAALAVDPATLESEAPGTAEPPPAPEVHPLLVGEAWDAFKEWARKEMILVQLGRGELTRKVENP